MASGAAGAIDLMFNDFVKYIREVRHRRAELKAASANRSSLSFSEQIVKMQADGQKERIRL